MKQQTAELVSDLASGKTALGVGIGTATSPAWISFINSDAVSAFVLVLGAVVSIVIILVVNLI